MQLPTAHVHSIIASNPDTALADGLWWMKAVGERNTSRNGAVIQAPQAVATVYPNPQQRVMFSALRDANPFFHLFESLWMLAGRNDVAQVANYAKQMESFADDGLLWGAYGFRWRFFFGFDQMLEIVKLLKQDPKTRRAVMSMWSPSGDLVPEVSVMSKDIPCNTQVYFDATLGRLNMTVTNRSNDIVWGAYGANVVHMSLMHEFVASAAGLPLGHYTQFSNNWHLYSDRPDVQRLIDCSDAERSRWAIKFAPDNRYTSVHMPPVTPKPLMALGDDALVFLGQVEALVNDPSTPDSDLPTDFLRLTAKPMVSAHVLYKAGDKEAALAKTKEVEATDWQVAAYEWVERRIAADAAKGQA